MQKPPTMGDSVLRAMTNDGGFRVITARTTDTVRGVAAAQRVTGRAARLLADLVTGAILVRETMAPRLRVQGVLQGPGGSWTLVADSSPDGQARGLVRTSQPDHVQIDIGTVLQMMRTLPRGDVHKGLVEVPAEGGLAEALMAYMKTSEQVACAISVGCQMEDDAVTAAGGYVVQLLPELEEGPLMVMTERLSDFPAVSDLLDSSARTPSALLEELLFGMEFTRLDESPLRFECWCSQLRVMTSLATLSRPDIEELTRGGTAIEITCDYCNQTYSIAPEQLRGLLHSA